MSIYRNPSISILYQHIFRQGLEVSNTGALLAYSGEKTGRSPLDKRIVKDETTKNIWWGNVNRPITSELFNVYHDYAKDYYTSRSGNNRFIIDGFAGWDREYPVSVYCSEAYHALFMKNMLVDRKNQQTNNAEISYQEPFTIYNLGHIGLSSVAISGVEPDASLKDTLIAINLTTRTMLIYGSRYAGEMKKGVFSWMMYQMPLEDKLCLHSSANRNPIAGDAGDAGVGSVGSVGDGNDNCSLFFGMSGTGKTTLSSDPERVLIGDDEHVWHDDGVFNIEGGCYAKCIDLSEKHEPDIYRAIKFGSVLENVITNKHENVPDYTDDSITKNTRCSYPLKFIENSAVSGPMAGKGGHPKQIVFLACDAWGLLPPISRLELDDAIDFFLCGYTSKMAGTEMGVNEPTPTFSACFGEPFLVWHPQKYADMLRERLVKHNTPVWLINSGWSKYTENGGDGGDNSERIPLRYTRKMVDFINTENLAEDKRLTFYDYNDICDGMFKFQIPVHPELDDIPQHILFPHKNWENLRDYQDEIHNLHTLFHKNLKEKMENQFTSKL